MRDVARRIRLWVEPDTRTQVFQAVHQRTELTSWRVRLRVESNPHARILQSVNESGEVFTRRIRLRVERGGSCRAQTQSGRSNTARQQRSGNHFHHVGCRSHVVPFDSIDMVNKQHPAGHIECLG